ncbi:Ig-like domain-containing protein [Catellatospora sp. KI3]|uniref:L,D-transpeptidase n=1 Tax=Catellatospora sp. KI3 TaxID=3041620 RepID=UPI00248273B7|nr:Ig-like domain-containing protein [Catellatospora sp. KI3]MDI1460602.1 Ig-like domain-containing protein [Catellatospora sp. KI3]
MGALRGVGTAAAALALAVPVLLSGCSDGERKQAAAPVAAPAPPPLTLVVTPAAQAQDLPASTEIGVAVGNASVRSVVLTGPDGRIVPGRMREDGTAWVPDRPLAYASRYSATVVATDGRRAVTQSTDFRTMAEPPRQVGTGLYLFDGLTYGVAMPVVVEFSEAIPDSARAAVESRLFVTTQPAQPGVWHWMSSRQVTYRAPKYWQPGTVLTVRAALKGAPMGEGRFGDDDRRATAKITKDKVELKVKNSTKHIQVYRNDKLVKEMPVSLGKSSTPSSSGTMVIMDKQESTIFDTTREPGVDHYRVTIQYAQRLTWGGEFIHSAPWSVGDQGQRNVSHGCLNVSPGNAVWLFENTHVGDPVTVKGTGHSLEPGNGFTAWDLSWKDFIKGSALPVPAALQPSAVAAVTPSASPAATPQASPAAAGPQPTDSGEADPADEDATAQEDAPADEPGQ